MLEIHGAFYKCQNAEKICKRSYNVGDPIVLEAS